MFITAWSNIPLLQIHKATIYLRKSIVGHSQVCTALEVIRKLTQIIRKKTDASSAAFNITESELR